MKFSIQNKIILTNIFIVLLALTIIGVIVIQGMLFYNIQHTENLLIEGSNNANLFLQQYILSKQKEDHVATKTSILKEDSAFLVEELAKQNNTRVQLFDQLGAPLSDSAALDDLPSADARQEIDIATGQGEKAYVVKKLKEGRFIYFASPIVTDNQQIGVVSFIYSLENVDNLIQKSVVLFIWAGLMGLILIYFISFYLTKRILKPIYTLRDSSEQIAKGHYQSQIQHISHDEIGDLTRSFNRMVSNIWEKIQGINSEKSKLESVISSIQDGIIAIDDNNNILALNQPAKEIFPMETKEELECILSFEFMKDLYESVQREQRTVIREIKHQDLYLLIYAGLIQVATHSIGYIFVIRDITKIRELEEKQSQFISSVSHELRTPLTTIIGYSDLLKRRGADNPEILDKSMDTIHREGNRLLRLVDDLLNLSKFENMEFDLIMTEVDLVQLIGDVVTQMKIKAEKYNNELQFTYTPLPKINGDYDRLKQVFINIIDNAIKYSFGSNIIQVYTEQEDGWAIISVRDYGPGIPADSLEEIFEPFYRLDKVRSRNMGGSGLGLAIVREIVVKHGGSIHVESKEDEGTLMIVKLPTL